MDSEFYSIKEAAIIFGVHQNTIRRALKKGFLIAIRIGIGKSIEAIHSSIIKDLASKAAK